MPLGRRLAGELDSRSRQAIFSRGKNVYNGGTSAAHSGGGPQFGRPRKSVSSGVVPGNPTPQGQPGMSPYMAAIRRRLMRGQRGPNS